MFECKFSGLCALTASTDIRKAYRQYLGVLVELTSGEMSNEGFLEVAERIYCIFSVMDLDSQSKSVIIERK